jgi:hypothetical protein
VLDPEAWRSYRLELAGLHEELAEAEGWGDVERAARLREQIDVIAGELTRASGLGARARKAPTAAERAHEREPGDPCRRRSQSRKSTPRWVRTSPLQ